MKIVITGSLGHISKPLTEDLLQKGHSVIVVSSSLQRKEEIEQLGASAAIGTVDDAVFLAKTFSGADAVYCMLPGGEHFFDRTFDMYAYAEKIATNFKGAIEASGVKKVIHLSSIGGHTNKNNGLLRFHYDAENIMRQLAEEVVIKQMRPVGFYYNMLAFIPAIKNQGSIISNYHTTYQEPWVSPVDIAAVIAEEFETPFEKRTIRYIASDELTSDETAAILGNAIGKPDLQWNKISDQQLLNGMVGAGMNLQVAKGLVEMNAARGSGELFEDYFRNKPVLGKHKLADFANAFATAYQQK